MRAWQWVTGLALAAAAACADTVVLTNGRTLDGVIVSESADTVVLNVGVGEVRLKRSQIRSLQRSDASATSASAGWSKAYFADPRFTPERFQALAASYRETETLRRAAFAAQAARVAAEQRLATIEKDLPGAEELVASTGRAMRSTPTNNITAEPARIADYNAKVQAFNNAQGALVGLLDEARRLRKTLDDARPVVGDYIRSVDAFHARLRAGKVPDKPWSDDETAFVAELSNRVAAMRGDLRAIEIPVADHGDHAILETVINGSLKARLILDTGASKVVLSRAIAGPIASQPDAEAAEVRLADGSTRPATAVTLARVRVGEAEVRNVEALILDEPPGDDVDGLLGMSFLKEFVVHLDASGSGKLELLRLKGE